MPQLCQDRLTQEWVFVATESVKPQELLGKHLRKPQPPLDPDCALCPNLEDRKTCEPLRIPSAGVGSPISCQVQGVLYGQ